MRLARKLFLLATMAIAALALSAGAASAEVPVEVSDEITGEHCPAVSPTSGPPPGHVVTGGCVVEFQSTEHIPLVVYTPSPIVLFACNWHFTARVGETGEGFVTAMTFTDEVPPTNPPCTRRPCDEANGTQLPWPLHIIEHAPGDEEAETELCFRTLSSGPGGPQSRCELHFEFNEIADHQHEIGHDPSEEFCEVSPAPPAPVSFRNAHFLEEADSAPIEVNH
jgi:hypothetical protein